MIRSRLGALYRKCAAPFGLRALDRMLRDGLPARLGPPPAFVAQQYDLAQYTGWWRVGGSRKDVLR
jgi:hypothetical protein